MVFSIPTSLPAASITPLNQLCCILDHLINAIGSQKLSCLCLLDLSAAFDTIDHNILITRLSSWFGIQGSVLNWFESYLTSRSFCVKYDKDFSSEHFFLWCSSRLCSRSSTFCHVYYPTQHSHLLISSLSLNHHSYADDTRLFFSFHPRNFDSSISHPRLLCSWFPVVCLITFLLLTLLRLNFSLSVSNSNFLK